MGSTRKTAAGVLLAIILGVFGIIAAALIAKGLADLQAEAARYLAALT